MIYWARPKNGSLNLSTAEHHDIRWCTDAELDELQPADVQRRKMVLPQGDGRNVPQLNGNGGIPHRASADGQELHRTAASRAISCWKR